MTAVIPGAVFQKGKQVKFRWIRKVWQFSLDFTGHLEAFLVKMCRVTPEVL